MRIEVPDGTLVVLPSGDTRLLEAIELKIAIRREKSDTTFERKVYGEAGVAFASKMYMGAHVLFSMLQQGDHTSVAASIRTPDGRNGHVIALEAKVPKRKK
jgi:hypothetical protein